MGLLDAIRKAQGQKALRKGLNTRLPEPRRELTPKEEAELERWIARAKAKEQADRGR